MATKIIAIKTTGEHPIHITELKSETGTWLSRETLYNLVNNGSDYEVGISPSPVIVPAVSSLGTHYVHSKGDGTSKDDLLSLPRE